MKLKVGNGVNWVYGEYQGYFLMQTSQGDFVKPCHYLHVTKLLSFDLKAVQTDFGQEIIKITGPAIMKNVLKF